MLRTESYLMDVINSTVSLSDLKAQFDTWKVSHPGYIIIKTTISTTAFAITEQQTQVAQKEYMLLIEYTDFIDNVLTPIPNPQ